MEKISPFPVSVLSLILAIIGLAFDVNFQSMAYWGQNGSLTMGWYWLGAGLTYLFTFISILLLFLKKKSLKLKVIDFVFRSIGLFISVITLLWTTFVVIAWQSGL